MEKIVLFQEKRDCCGCSACMNICLNQAIAMKEDEYGFIYPSIVHEKCVRCGMCQKVCGYQHKEEETKTRETYVAMAKDDSLLQKSASGGIFAAVATEIIKCGGAVFGCAFDYHDGALYPEHIMIDTLSELYKLQGSKYVQSTMGKTYQQVKEELKKGRNVLFSGTPCQVAALNSFLGNVNCDNLLTIDIICHGTPSSELFRSYIKELEKGLKGKVTGFKFRDKSGGWGLKGSMEYTTHNGTHKKKLIPVQLSSYYKLFLDSDTYRENCYSCKYAGPNRTGDLTIGDYWGIEKEHPDYLARNGGVMDERKGISCVLVNTEKGKRLMEQFELSSLYVKPSTFEKAAGQNRQLKQPSHRSEKREIILELYKNNGYSAVDAWYYKRLGVKRYVYAVWNMIPRKVQIILKKFM